MADEGLAAFNALPDDVAAERLATCLHARAWVSGMLQGRPYRGRESLLEQATKLGPDEVDEALAAHPRIGERPAGDTRSEQLSRQEQGGVGPELAAELRQANVQYEERFGRVFLIRAAGRSGPEILAALRERLGHDDATEAAVVRGQLVQIAQLRLAALLDELGA